MAKADAIIRDTGEIVEIRPGGLALPGKVTSLSLELPADLPYEQWRGIGETLRGVERSLMWWIGDWLRYGEKRYGETYREAEAATGAAYQTLANAKLVAERVEISRRRENLSWSHHAEVAGVTPAQADALLTRAAAEGLSVRALRQEVGKVRSAQTIGAPIASPDTCEIADLHALAASGRKFGCIYLDPPWLYDNQGTRAATGNHYGGMTVAELCELPVDGFAAEDAHLHLWTTNAFLFEAPRLFAAWGFEFRSSLVWVKRQMGIGNYWRNSHEILLTAIRGDAKRFNDHSMMSWLECDRGRHSEKPEQVRSMLERASPGPYIELFARFDLGPPWSVWGNQVERTLFNQSLERAA